MTLTGFITISNHLETFLLHFDKLSHYAGGYYIISCYEALWKYSPHPSWKFHTNSVSRQKIKHSEVLLLSGEDSYCWQHSHCKANVTPNVFILAASKAVSGSRKVGVYSVCWASSQIIRGLCFISHLNGALSGSGAPTSLISIYHLWRQLKAPDISLTGN